MSTDPSTTEAQPETDTETTPETAARQTNWQVAYDDIAPIRIRDPVAEALCVLDPGDPFVIDYADIVTAAGHSCPTAAGAYRITQLGLDALYPDATAVAGEGDAADAGDAGDGDAADAADTTDATAPSLPVRGDIEVLAGGPKADSTYGVMSRIVSYITGAAAEDGFGGLAGGHGDRRNHLHFGDLDTIAPTFRFHRTDTGDTVEVRYHVSEVPDAGPATQHLPALVSGDATPDQREAFASVWHGRIETVLTDDSLFTVENAEWPLD